MKTKTILAVIALTFLPNLVMAACSAAEHTQSTMSCAEGKIFDSATKSCVPVSG